MGDGLSLSLVRKHCVECSAGDRRAVLWCTCDGTHGSRCEMWRFRLGMKPATVRRRLHPGLVDPSAMPSSAVSLDDLPGTIPGAVAWLAERGRSTGGAPEDAPLGTPHIGLAKMVAHRKRSTDT